MAINNLSDWIESEIRRRKISVREFARLCDLSSEVVNRLHGRDNAQKPGKTILKNKGAKYPNLKTLVKMADATNTDLCALVLLCLPAQKRRNYSSQDLLLSQRIARLSAADRRTVDSLVTGLAFDSSESSAQDD